MDEMKKGAQALSEEAMEGVSGGSATYNLSGFSPENRAAVLANIEGDGHSYNIIGDDSLQITSKKGRVYTSESKTNKIFNNATDSVHI